MASRSTRRRGSRQFWPRVRAQKITARVGSWKGAKTKENEAKILGFCGYKVGMTNITAIDNFSNTITKGTKINVPVTIIECPAVNVLSIKGYNYDELENLQVCFEYSRDELVKDKNLSKKINVKKKKDTFSSKIKSADDLINLAKEKDCVDVRVKVSTTPSNTGLGQKKPHIVEFGISGSIEDAIKFAFEKAQKEVKLSEVLSAGELVDSHGITKGFGFQGPIKRFGAKLTSHKSEKKRRKAGNVGGAWTPKRMLTTALMPGQTGYHTRCEWNKWILKLSDKVDEINSKSGFNKYGVIKNEYMLIKGSIQGPKKRLITFVKATRPNKRYPKIAPEITYISK